MKVLNALTPPDNDGDDEARVQSLIAAARELWASGLNNIGQACRLFAEAFSVNPAIAAPLMSDFPPAAIDRMLQVGRGLRAEQLLTEATPGHHALAKCDLATQLTYLDAPIPVVNPSKPNEHSLIPVAELGSDQIKQVFERGHIRSLCKQRSWIEKRDRNRLPKLASIDKPYVAFRGRVRWTRPCEVSVSELLRIIDEASR
jgi:hypothetical protein